MTDKEKIRKEVERMHNLLPIVDGDNISLNYADRICTTLEMYIDSLQEEPVNKDLEYASEKYACRFSSSKYGHDKVKDAFIAGAKWQKEQMTKDAIDAVVHIDAGGYPYIPQIELYDYDKDIPLANAGDNVKMIIMKGE